MSDVDRHDELEGMVAPWVLGALDEADGEAVRTHVEGCATCREVAVRLRRVVGALPLAAEEVVPPPRLRAKVLAAAEASRERAAGVSPPVTRRKPVRPPPAAGFTRRIPIYALAAVALVSLLVGVLVGQVALRAPTPATTQVARFTLTGHGTMTGAHATVVDLRSDGVALADFRGMPALASGRVYELWLLPAHGDPVPAAVFVPDNNGERVVVVSRSLEGYTVMAVTEEPGPDGSAAPSQQPQLYGDVA
jgi:anti-sigma-K factor RskA